MGKYQSRQVIQSDLLIPIVGGHDSPFQGSLSHPQKGHKELPGVGDVFFFRSFQRVVFFHLLEG